MQYRLVQEEDAQLLSEYYLANTKHFREWEPKKPTDFHELDNWAKRIHSMLESQERNECAYFIAESDGRVMAHCSLTQIVFGAFRACYMGYGASKEVEGKGVAYQLCCVTVRFAFDELGLNRVMANHLPYNNRSAKLLSRLGFVREGFAKKYLKINGKWQDHVLTAKYK